MHSFISGRGTDGGKREDTGGRPAGADWLIQRRGTGLECSNTGNSHRQLNSPLISQSLI